MGSEVFKLKSLYIDDTVVRGARVSMKNASTTQALLVNPGDDPQLKTGETGVNADYLLQASLVGNDLRGYGTFTHNSKIVQGYSGPQDIVYSDSVRLNTDKTFYTATGIIGTDLYLTSNYTKEQVTDPDVQSGDCTLRKIKLDSARYELIKSSGDENKITYDKDKLEWKFTGMNTPGYTGTSSSAIILETGLQILFQTTSTASAPDLMTVNSVVKTVVANSTNEMLDIAINPIPYPHQSLKVYLQEKGTELRKIQEFEDYIINYSQNPEYMYPPPPYEQRTVAYMRLLDKMTDEVQVPVIDATFQGLLSINKIITQNGATGLRPINNIIPETDSFKIDSTDLTRSTDYVINNQAGTSTFVKHENNETLIQSITYPRALIWDGVNVIKGVGIRDVKDFNNLVVPGVPGLQGITGVVYFEDTDENNLVSGTDYTIEYGSGAVKINAPLKSGECVLVSYYVEGEDETKETIKKDVLRTSHYPVIVDSLTLTMKWNSSDAQGNVRINTRVLIEGTDFTFSYLTGRITLLTEELLNDETATVDASYTPMAEINCVLQPIADDQFSYTMTIIDDALTVLDTEKLIFQVNNPVVSVLKQDPLLDFSDPDRYSLQGSIIENSLTSFKILDRPQDAYSVTGYQYLDQAALAQTLQQAGETGMAGQDAAVTKFLQLDPAVNEYKPKETDTALATYSFVSDLLPYASVQIIFPILPAGATSFVIDGFDRTDVLKPDNILRISNFDPEGTYYFRIRDAVYIDGSTLVSIYGSFPVEIRKPSFYVFDSPVTWTSLPSATVVDTSILPGSEAILLRGGTADIAHNIKANTLVMINGQDIYTVGAVTITGDATALTISPTLLHVPTGIVVYTPLPVYTAGDTLISTQYTPLTTPAEPAFKLSYVPPQGFEGSASILINAGSITLTETIRATPNPQSYVFKFSDYTTVYELAKAIQGTASTYKQYVPFSDAIPDYNPFTISPDGITEDYFLAPGSYAADLIVPFGTPTAQFLPYTVTTSPELLRYSLIETFKGQASFKVSAVNKTALFLNDSLVSFIDAADGKSYYYEVSSSEFDHDTTVNLKAPIAANMVNPQLYTSSAVNWITYMPSNAVLDTGASEVVFTGGTTENIRKGTLLKISGDNIFYADGVSTVAGDYRVHVKPQLPVGMYGGRTFIRYSSSPVYQNDPGEQPFVVFGYGAPEGHTGQARIKITMTQLILEETVDNLTVTPNVYTFSDYTDINELADDIINTESSVSGVYPYYYYIADEFVTLFNTQGFSGVRFALTDYVAIPQYFLVAVGTFTVHYAKPAGYTGIASMEVTSTAINLYEDLMSGAGVKVQKGTSIPYASTSTFIDLATNAIPQIWSGVTGIQPFSTVLGSTVNFVKDGFWNATAVIPGETGYNPVGVSGQKVFAAIRGDAWTLQGILNIKRIELDTDYSLDTGNVSLTTAISKLDRFLFDYMGLWRLDDQVGKKITCTCNFFKTLQLGSTVMVALDYQNIDQFYLQKLTERKFSQIVVVPQIKEILSQLGNGGGQGSDNGADNSATPVYLGGTTNFTYLLRDEEIKKQLYLRFYQWYKKRLRNFSAELQLTLGFKFAHSNALGDLSGSYSLADADVEKTNDYTLTRASDFDQAVRGFGKFFPIGYDKVAPYYYPRFSGEYLTYNEVYCCNIKYKDVATNKVVTKGVIKSERPYWARESDLNFVIIQDSYVNISLVSPYQVDIPAEDRTYGPSAYTFLKRIDVGDKVKLEGSSTYLTIKSINQPWTLADTKTYEYLFIDSPISGNGAVTYNLVYDDPNRLKDKNGNPVEVSSLLDNLPSDGLKMWVKRTVNEPFPVYDDSGSLGSIGYSDYIPNLKKHTHRKKASNFAALMAFLFPAALLADKFSPRKFSVDVKQDSEDPNYDEIENVDLSKMGFKNRQNIDDVTDALKYNFTEMYTIPAIPPILPLPVTIYDNIDSSDRGLYRYFYITIETVYNSDDEDGYHEVIVLRSKDKYWSFKTNNVNGSLDIIENYGFNVDNTYLNCYDPDNIYKKLLLEKQAWQVEEMVMRDLFDHSDKLARAFENGQLDKLNKTYRDYLAKQTSGTVNGISDLLINLILAYEKQLAFLVSPNGPLYGIIRPYGIDEDDASAAIAMSYQQAITALNTYSEFYSRCQFYRGLNIYNNRTWRDSYVRWVMGLEQGLIYQKDARGMYEVGTGKITVGIKDLPAIKLSVTGAGSYIIKQASVSIAEDMVYYDSYGRTLYITYTLQSKTDPTQILGPYTTSFKFYTVEQVLDTSSAKPRALSDVCDEINAYKSHGSSIFFAQNIFDHYENGITNNMFLGSWDLDITNGTTLYVTNVADHRKADPRVLFLNRNVEDRIYTQDLREKPGLKVKYTGSFYADSATVQPMLIKANVQQYPPLEITFGFSSLKWGILLNQNLKKILVFTGQYLYPYGNVFAATDVTLTYECYDTVNNRYRTIQELTDLVKADEYSPGIKYFDVTVLDDMGESSSEDLSVTDGFVDAVSPTVIQNYWSVKPYSLIEDPLRDMDVDLNRGIYRVFYAEDTGHKTLEIRFDKVITKDGIVFDPTDTTDIVFTFDTQKDDSTFKTLSEFATEISAFRYRNNLLFTASSLVVQQTNSCRYLVADNTDRFMGFDTEYILYVDPYLDTFDVNQESALNTTQVQNAYYSFPIYTANGNPGKAPIEGIPLSGKWDVDESVDVMEVRCIDGQEWEIEFRDYGEGDYKTYMGPQDVINQIDTEGIITEEQYAQIKAVPEKPVLTILKKMILTRKSVIKDEILEVDLRQDDTISKTVDWINNFRFDAEGNPVPPIYGGAGTLIPMSIYKVFDANILGDPAIEGTYKSYEIEVIYIPIIKDFYVTREETVDFGGGSHTYTVSSYKSNQLVGWQLQKITVPVNTNKKFRVISKRYSPGDTYVFNVDGPETSRNNTLNKLPVRFRNQEFKTDILAFDIFSWDSQNADGVRKYVISHNWIYFKSSGIDYNATYDLGQPNKQLGFGIPLAGSGHPSAPENETLKQLVDRINDNGYVSQWFFANLKFVRDDVNNPGNFEYTYLPDLEYDVPKAALDELMLRDDTTIVMKPGDSYTFTASSYSIDHTLKTMNMSCDWSLAYNYRLEFDLTKPAYNTITKVVNSINASLAPEAALVFGGLSVFQAAVVGAHGPNVSTNLLSIEPPTTVPAINMNLNATGPVAVMTLKVRNVSGVNFTIQSATAEIPVSRNKLILSCSIVYKGTYPVSIPDTSIYTIKGLADYFNAIRPYTSYFFTQLFNFEVVDSFYNDLEATRLLDATGSIVSENLMADLSDIVGIRLLNMSDTGLVTVSSTHFIANSGDYTTLLPADKDLYKWVDAIKGNFSTGMLYINILPMKVLGTTYGTLRLVTEKALTANAPTHVFFGIMGDIKFIQISDFSLYRQFNFVKERLAQPWKQDGVVRPDYYTPEMYNGPDNIYGIDIDHFLGYLRTSRYKQVHDSVINEAVVQNKYFWIYMKFHREFGCDQKAIVLKKQIDENQTSLNQMGSVE